MENFEGTIGSITAAVLKSGLKPTTAVQLIVRVGGTFLVLSCADYITIGC